jgi:hypothetical protein
LSLRRKVSHFLALVVIAALAVGAMTAPAMAKSTVKHKMTAKQKSHIRAQLRKQIKHNPKAIMRKSFLKKAALVNFKLPVTLRLRGGNTPGSCPFSGNSGSTFNTSTCNPTSGVVPGNSNPNSADLDLGASLGHRTVDLGGTLAAEIVFHDSFDGGALGNVDLTILPSSTKALTTTSIPLLWNSDISNGGTFFESNDLYNGTGLGTQAIPSGCGNYSTVTNSNAVPNAVGATADQVAFGYKILSSGYSGGQFPNSPYGPGNLGIPGYPVYDAYGGPGSGGTGAQGFLPIVPGINDTSAANVGPRAGTVPGNNDLIGPSPNPFPSSLYPGANQPGGFTPTAKDTVLRTNALSLTVAQAGTPVDQSSVGSGGVQSGENIVLGKSGGTANLFGNIPGKSYGIDVTVNLATKINSILRVVDQDAYHFNCQQIWTGAVQNYIPDVRLTGNLKIAPGLTSDGHLRIAKATVQSQAGFPSHFGVAACLFPNTTYAKRLTGAGALSVVGPTVGNYGPTGANGYYADRVTGMPVDSTVAQAAPSAACGTGTDPLVTNSALSPNSVTGLNPASGANGYTVTADGSRVSVAADLSVTNVSIDVLIGDV